MPSKIIKDYFSFTKKERIGVIILVFIILIIFIIPSLLPEKKESINKADWEQFKTQSARLLTPKKDPQIFDRDGEGHPSPYYVRADSQNNVAALQKYSTVKSELFYFDPNTLAEKGWEKLGLRSKTISTIQNYLAKGGKFRRSEDLAKIYGLHKNELEKLIPYVKINVSPTEFKTKRNDQNFHEANSYFPPSTKYSASASIVDLNTADTTQLIALPGIGSKLALRIIHFREKLGAFHSVDQLSDVYGLPDSTFQKLLSRLAVSAKTLRLVNINTADVNELKQLPYLQWNVVNAIIEFRGRHGDFKNIDELLQIEIYTPAMHKKVAPYLTVQ